jgi:hypothetical protein
VIRTLWRARWNVLRLLIAAAILYVFATDTGARIARLQLASLPDFDYAAEVRALREQGRLGEALVIADAGLEDADLSPEARAAIVQERDLTVARQNSVLQALLAAGKGALTGDADSLEGLIGAVATDFFIVGDLRDLVIEGGKQVIDGDGDGVILTLSVLGVVTTLAPEVDWVPSLLKAAARAGTLTPRMAEFLKNAIKRKRTAEIMPLFDDLRAISSHASPGGAMRLLRHCEDPRDAAAIARYLENTGRRGAFALHITGVHGADLVKRGEHTLLIKAARKGRPGAAMLRNPSMKALMRPHPLLGVAKALWKGNAEKTLSRLLDRIDPGAWWLVPALAAWVVIELSLLVQRFRPRRAAPTPAP